MQPSGGHRWPGSPAIDAGNPAGCMDHLGNPLATDQRGTPRPLDGDGDGNAVCDMGSFELDPVNDRFTAVFLPCVARYYCPDFFDNFSNPASGWEVVDDSFVRSEYLSGEYRILTKRAGHYYFFRAPACDRQNYVVEVDARWDKTGLSHGLIFGLTSDHRQFYTFQIDPLRKMWEFAYWSPEGMMYSRSTSSEAIHGGTSSNHLKVTRNGDEIILEVNGTVLDTLSDSTIGGPTGVGLVTYPGGASTSDVRFDNFSVVSLGGSGAPAPGQGGVMAEESERAAPNAWRVPAPTDLEW